MYMNKKSVQYSTPVKPIELLPLVVIVGPTASGKSATAMRIAREFNGEIICADSRTIYTGMDIGTAKPSTQDQAEVPHWGLDLVQPGEPFTAADFKKYALKKIEEIRTRGHLPMLVGGTGLYVDGVIFDYEFVEPNLELRKSLEALSLDELKKYCANNNVSLPENQQNRRYVIREIERQNVSGKRLLEPIANTLVVGIATERDVLRTRIKSRSEQLFENGMVEEAKILGEKYGWDSEAMTGNIYKLVKQFLNNEFDEAELRQRFFYADWQLAKRQLTWLKRNQFIHWAELDEAYEYIKKQLSLPTESE
jgi:tRNA dimethylallyltransferase